MTLPPDPSAARGNRANRRQWAQHMTLTMVAVLAIVVLVSLRIRMMPRVTPEVLSGLYDEMCELLRADASLEPLHDPVRDHVRSMSHRLDVVFVYQLVRADIGREEAPRGLEPVELPIREAIRGGDFEAARGLVQAAIREVPAMTEARGELWLELIARLERRWDHGCRVDGPAPG